MKIAAATDDGINITGHVGRCKAFIVFDISDGKIKSSEIRENTFTHHATGDHNHDHQHGHSHKGLIDALQDCSTLLFQGGGWRLVEDLKANNIKPFLTSENNAFIAVEKFIKNELAEETNLVCNKH